jgi:hypothetical protein
MLSMTSFGLYAAVQHVVPANITNRTSSAGAEEVKLLAPTPCKLGVAVVAGEFCSHD